MNLKSLALFALLAISFAVPVMAQPITPQDPLLSDRDRIKADRAKMDVDMKAESKARPWDGLNLLRPKSVTTVPLAADLSK